jgi:hypothetical protein
VSVSGLLSVTTLERQVTLSDYSMDFSQLVPFCELLFRGQFVFSLPFLILDSFYVVLFTKVHS